MQIPVSKSKSQAGWTRLATYRESKSTNPTLVSRRTRLNAPALFYMELDEDEKRKERTTKVVDQCALMSGKPKLLVYY